ncbi:hypothetical protein HPB47_003747, partial [Ixodes persulcatus]
METSVCSFMRACLDSYDALRGKCPKKENAVFWDAVVISAADEQQAAAFRLQIQRKKERGLLPLVPYHVVSDLPGAKMGSGGATLHVLERLAELYGDRSFAMRTLLIHTGGQSKRLPSHSVLGKLFALLPLSADTEFQMLDLKLAMAVLWDGSCEEIAFTDSAFFFDSSVMCRMLRFYEKVKPLSYEIDAYGDFLKALGTKARDVGNVDAPDGCGDTKPSIQDELRSSDLRVIVLPSSRFYHLGTTLEYIENLCTSKTFE